MKTRLFAILIILSFALATMLPVIASAKTDDTKLTVIELKVYDGKPDGTPGGGKPGGGGNTDNSLTNDDYSLLRYHWYTTANYYVNPSNSYGFSANDVTNVVQTSTGTWDAETSGSVFSYEGITALAAGSGDGTNVVSWGSYQAGVIAVTFIWSQGSQIVETDLMLNTNYGWSLSGESNKMDAQNILTHEFGHWAGLNDLYKKPDSWLTMYGYSNYGVTFQRTLGLGDILGLQAVYGQ
jgi:hypothetical protein